MINLVLVDHYVLEMIVLELKKLHSNRLIISRVCSMTLRLSFLWIISLGEDRFWFFIVSRVDRSTSTYEF